MTQTWLLLGFCGGERSVGSDTLVSGGGKTRVFEDTPVVAGCGMVLLKVWWRLPASGTWGGLWCFPEIDQPNDHKTRTLDLWGLAAHKIETGETFRHTFSHYHLDITPVVIELGNDPDAVMEATGQLWYNLRQPPQIGLAAPVAELLSKLGADSRPLTTDTE